MPVPFWDASGLKVNRDDFVSGIYEPLIWMELLRIQWYSVKLPSTTICNIQAPLVNVEGAHQADIWSISFPPSSSDVAITCGQDGVLKRWNLRGNNNTSGVESFSTLLERKTHALTSIALMQNCGVVSCDDSSLLFLYEM